MPQERKASMEEKEPQHDATLTSHTSTPERPLLPLTHRDAAPGEKATSLVFLDGIRGIAAMMVYSHHHITEFYGMDCDLMHGYGYEGRYHFAQWRPFRFLLAGGTPAVMIFFVLSGYVLSRGALQMVQNEKTPSTILQYLLNAFLRRPTRLWLPPILISFPVALALHTPFRPVGALIPIQSNIFAELQAYIVNLIETVNPFTAHGPFFQLFEYDPPVWTMAYELNGSVMVYALLAVCGPYLSLRNRIFALVISVFMSFEFGHFSLPPFAFGMIIAQVDVAKLDQPWIDRMPENIRSWVFNAIFIVSWYFLSDMGPLVRSESPWFGLPSSLIPWIFYNNPNFATNIIGACGMVYAALRLSWLQTFFHRAAWLGRVSFALYLTHVPVIWFLALRVRRLLGAEVGEMEEKTIFDGIFPIPDVGPLGLTTRYLAMQLIVLPLNLMIAEFVTVWIDQPSVRWSKQFAARIMQKLHL